MWAPEEDARNAPDGEEVLKRPEIRIAVQAGTKALLALPVREQGQIIGGLSLLSRQRGLYGAKTKKTLERTGLNQALLAVIHGAIASDPAAGRAVDGLELSYGACAR